MMEASAHRQIEEKKWEAKLHGAKFEEPKKEVQNDEQEKVSSLAYKKLQARMAGRAINGRNKF